MTRRNRKLENHRAAELSFRKTPDPNLLKKHNEVYEEGESGRRRL